MVSVYDLVLANYGLDRGLEDENSAKDYAEIKPYTPAWGEQITGVAPSNIETIAREFADTAHKTHGRSMIILGAGCSHRYHMDMNYRGMINMLILRLCRAKRRRLGALCRSGKTAPTNRLVAARLCARLEPPTAPDEQHLVFLQSFQPMAL